LSFFVGVKLTKRTNQMFTKMIAHWLVSDQLVEYFVFTLKGFDFLLHTISSEPKPFALSVEESKSDEKGHKSAMHGSDLERMFMEAAIDTK